MPAPHASTVPTHRSWLDYLLVLPCSHVRFGDFQWQYAIYDVFHRYWPSKVTHALGMAPNTMLWLMLASLLPLGKVDGGLVAAAGLFALYLWFDRAVGVVLAPVLAGMWFGGKLILAAWGASAVPYTLVAVAGMAFFQAAGHIPEPVPPPWSGCDRFVPLPEFLRTASLGRLAAFAMLMTPFGTVMEFWAAPRLLPVQAMMLLNRLGYRPEFQRMAALKTRVFGSDITFAIDNRLPENAANA